MRSFLFEANELLSIVRESLRFHHKRLSAPTKPPNVASPSVAVFLSSGEWRQRGQALKNSPGISASLRGATVFDQWQAGQV